MILSFSKLMVFSQLNFSGFPPCSAGDARGARQHRSPRGRQLLTPAAEHVTPFPVLPDSTRHWEGVLVILLAASVFITCNYTSLFKRKVYETIKELETG